MDVEEAEKVKRNVKRNENGRGSKGKRKEEGKVMRGRLGALRIGGDEEIREGTVGVRNG